MAVTRVQWGEQAARQGQIARAQAAGARRGDELARERFTLDRQDSVRAERDALSRAREETAAKARAASGESRPAGPSQDRDTAAPSARAAALKRPGEAEGSKTAKPPAEPTDGFGNEPETGRALKASNAAPERATAPSGIPSADAEGTETSGLEAPPMPAMPAAIAAPVPAAASRHAAGDASEVEAGPASGGEDTAVQAGAGTAPAPTGDPATGATADDGGTAFATALAGAMPKAASDAAVPSAPGPTADRPTVLASAVPSSAHPGPAAASEPPVPIGAVPMTIGLRAMVGTNRFEMRLDPAELGRIDVTLDIDKDGRAASATLVVDSPATLALLRRDVDSLQQALAQAGFSTGDAGISLQLRQDGPAQDGASQDRSALDRQEAGRVSGPGATHDAPPLDAIPLRALRPVRGLDIRI